MASTLQAALQDTANKSVLLVPAHRGRGEGDYLWDWGFRRGTKRAAAITEFVNSLDTWAIPDDPDEAFYSSFVVVCTSAPLSDAQARTAKRLGISPQPQGG